MATIRGGRLRNWKDNRKGKNAKYQQHLREIAHQGKGFDEGGNEQGGNALEKAMHGHLIMGYNFKG